MARLSHQIWFVITAVLGVLFTLWGSLAPSQALLPGDIWLLFPGVVFILLGVLGFFATFLLSYRVRHYLQSLTVPSISLAALSEALDLSQTTLREVIFSLRVSGALQVSFDPKTGDLLLDYSTTASLCPVCSEPDVSTPYCFVCGNKQPVTEFLPSPSTKAKKRSA